MKRAKRKRNEKRKEIKIEENTIKKYLQFPRLSSMSKMMFVWPVSTSHS